MKPHPPKKDNKPPKAVDRNTKKGVNKNPMQSYSIYINGQEIKGIYALEYTNLIRIID